MDEFLNGGLPRGAVTEWGIPLGSGGREVILPWLPHEEPSSCPAGSASGISSGDWALWVHAGPRLLIYPPAWAARGVALGRVRFACSSRPLADLKPVFMEPLFRVIVLDSPRSFSEEDCAFLARQARVNDQVILLLRDFFLGPKRGNVWARLRLNCWMSRPRAGETTRFHVKVVRGLPPREVSLEAEDIVRPFRTHEE